MRGSSALAAAASSALAWHVREADGHCFQTKPVSRQFLHTTAFNSDGKYGAIEKHADAYNGGGADVVKRRQLERTDPDVLAKYGGGDVWPLAAAWDLGEIASNNNYLENDDIAVSHGVCGDTRQSGDDLPYVYSTPNSGWNVLEDFEPGQTIDIEILVTNYHWGHIEYFLCDTQDMDDPDGVPQQSCFNKYPLNRAPDDDFNSPVDADYPGRYYVNPPCRGENNEINQDRPELQGVLNDGTVNRMRYVLPDIECEHCILMMRYHSGRGCRSPGYREFNPASWHSKCAPDKEDWIAVNAHKCNASGGRKWGNMFWNCADIAIKSSSSGDRDTPTPETPEPAPAPVSPEPEPTPELTPAPMVRVVPAPMDEPVDPAVAPVDDSADVEAEYLGCHHDSKDDRVLGAKTDSTDMNLAVCLEYCTGKGATFMALQFRDECWCSAEMDLDYERHYNRAGEDAVCDMPCRGDKSVTCGGNDSFDLYKLTTCSGDAVEPYEQCGGLDWDGPTCCMAGYKCIDLGAEAGCYAQCQPTM